MEYADRVQIATPEGVDVELTLAGIGSRFIAAIFDLAIQGGTLLAIFLLLGATGDIEGVAAAIFSVATFLIFFAYDVLFEVRSHGRTLGKRWTGLRVVRTGGRPVNFVTSAIRNVMRIVDILPGFYAIGMLAIFVTGRNQRLGDLAAGTFVIRDRTAGSDADGESGIPDYIARKGASAQDWDVSSVSATDAATIRQFLDRRSALTSASRYDLASDLERRLRPHVAGAPDDLDPEEFLERLAAAKAARA